MILCTSYAEDETNVYARCQRKNMNRDCEREKTRDSQAAFRKKRDAYVATLEETVNNLEAIAEELKRSHEENCAEVQEWREENRWLREQIQDQERSCMQQLQLITQCRTHGMNNLQYDNIVQDTWYVA
jgi:hypothetical protein